MRTLKWVVSGSLSLAVMGAAGCDCGSPVDPGEVDAFRMGRDTGPPGEDTGELADIGPVDAPPVIGEDIGPVDAFVPEGIDAGPGAALTCVHRHTLGEDLFRLSVDNVDDVPSFTSVVRGPTGELVGVYSSSDHPGAPGVRSLEVFRVIPSGPDMGPVAPAVIPASTGASLPTLVPTTDGYWLAYVQGGNIFVARFSATFSPMGSPSMIAAAAGITTPPELARTSTGGYVAWVSGTTIRGRSLSNEGAGVGREHALVMGATAIQQAALQRIGMADSLALAWATGDAEPRIAPLDPTAGTLGTSDRIAGDPGIFTSIDMGGISAGMGLAIPLAGAAVYDLNDLGFRDVLFRVISDTALPSLPVAAVASDGDQAWGATVEPFLSGYALAYRATLADVPGTVLRVGYLDREACRVGAVSDRYVVGRLGSDTGAPPELSVSGGVMMIVWSDELASSTEYWAATLTCTERT